jgi:hypothetical protein
MTKKWSMPIPNWNAAMAHFLIDFFGNYQLSRKSGKKLLKLGARDEI